MHSPSDEVPSQHVVAPIPDWPSHPEIEPRETRNLLLLATHQIVLRVGWIFKTESVIMPAFLDHVAGAGWIRGCLPILNRLGQSLPPIFLANSIKAMRHKKRALAMFAVLMSLPFGILSAVWFATGGGEKIWMTGLFLALYFMFFVFYGMYHLSFGTVQGKLIRPTRRGSLLLTSTFWGSVPAVLFAWWLLGKWLHVPNSDFGCIFAFTAVCFFLSGLTALVLFEPGDQSARRAIEIRGGLGETLHTLRRDANLRRLMIVAMSCGSGMIIFPHYQALARIRLGLDGVHLMVWVITQSLAVGVYSLFVGPLADARGNRLTLRTLIFGSAVAPAFAILLPHLPGRLGENLFWMVFIPLAISPLLLRTLLNYALEICQPAEHPRYLSIVSLGLAVPFVFAPAVGWLVDATSFELVFLSTVGLIILSGCLTFRLDEPRWRVNHGKAGSVGVGAAE